MIRLIYNNLADLAQVLHCTYIAMDEESPALQWRLVDSLNKLVNEKLKITEVVTDSHSQIIKFMREKHPDKVYCNDSV